MTTMYRSQPRSSTARRSESGPAFTAPTGVARRARLHRSRCRIDVTGSSLRAVRASADVRRVSVTRSPRRSGATVYRRRRRVVGLAVAAIVGVLGFGLQALLTDSGDGPAAAAGVVSATSAGFVVRVEAGDSMWSIAQQYRGEHGINDYIDALVRRNGGTVIQAGQLLTLP